VIARCASIGKHIIHDAVALCDADCNDCVNHTHTSPSIVVRNCCARQSLNAETIERGNDCVRRASPCRRAREEFVRNIFVTERSEKTPKRFRQIQAA
jgi:hypothetical protein